MPSISSANGEPNWQASCVIYLLANCATNRGDFVHGARLFGAAQLLQEQFPPFAGFTWAAVEIQMLEANGEILRGVLGEEPYEREMSLGRTLPYDEAYRLALVRTR